jgi:hypothetical protein
LPFIYIVKARGRPKDFHSSGARVHRRGTH